MDGFQILDQRIFAKWWMHSKQPQAVELLAISHSFPSIFQITISENKNVKHINIQSNKLKFWIEIVSSLKKKIITKRQYESKPKMLTILLKKISIYKKMKKKNCEKGILYFKWWQTNVRKCEAFFWPQKATKSHQNWILL